MKGSEFPDRRVKEMTGKEEPAAGPGDPLHSPGHAGVKWKD